MKAVALVVSARKYGNCFDLVEFMLKRLKKTGIETELINFYDYQVAPCQTCNYECVQKFDPEKGVNTECPITDDVKPIWKKTWNAEILLLFVPTYGGLPPALWVAFSQRTQGILEKPPKENLEKYVVTAVVLASPHWSGIGERTPSIVADQIKNMERKIAGFEVVNNSGFETENLFGGLINEEEIQRRLKFLADQTLQVLNENQ
jgi:multimeric flavodoxin WrbA